MKRCTKYTKDKPFDCFSKNKQSKDGYQYHCKSCLSIYYKDNRESLDKKAAQYRRENTHINHKYYLNNKDVFAEYNKTYNKSNAKFNTYKDKLTIDESPRLASDGVSLEVKCRYCGKYYIPTMLSVRTRVQSLNNSKSENGLYCSQGCKDACPIYNQVKYPKGYKKGTSREVQPQLRQLVLKRDKYTCQECGTTDIELHCHHIWPLNESPITSADVDECITYCKDCHKLKHTKISGCGYYEMRCAG